MEITRTLTTDERPGVGRIELHLRLTLKMSPKNLLCLAGDAAKDRLRRQVVNEYRLTGRTEFDFELGDEFLHRREPGKRGKTCPQAAAVSALARLSPAERQRVVERLRETDTGEKPDRGVEL